MVAGMSRAHRIREFFKRNPDQLFAMREIRDEVDPGCLLEHFSGSLDSLVRQGFAEKVGRGLGGAKFRKAAAPTQKPVATNAFRGTISGAARVRVRPVAPGPLAEPMPDCRARIAADVAAFEARGGRVERLGPTVFFCGETRR